MGPKTVTGVLDVGTAQLQVFSAVKPTVGGHALSLVQGVETRIQKTETETVTVAETDT